jgi:hypothetical protein
MQTSIPKTGLRPNPAGDWPQIDPAVLEANAILREAYLKLYSG